MCNNTTCLNYVYCVVCYVWLLKYKVYNNNFQGRKQLCKNEGVGRRLLENIQGCTRIVP